MNRRNVAKILGRIPSGIFVVASQKNSMTAGFLGSWIQQASFEPPAISMAVHQDRPIQEFLSPGAFFSVNVLGPENRKLYKRFAQGVVPGPEPFSNLRVGYASSGVPIFLDALGYLECKVIKQVSVGDHDLVIGEVLEGRMFRSGEPRIHVRRNGFTY